MIGSDHAISPRARVNRPREHSCPLTPLSRMVIAMRWRGLGIKRIQKALNLTRNQVIWLSRHPKWNVKRFRERRNRHLCVLYARGYSTEYIAHRYHLCLCHVQRILWKAGLSSAEPAKRRRRWPFR
jgi:hypothetical protein